MWNSFFEIWFRAANAFGNDGASHLVLKGTGGSVVGSVGTQHNILNSVNIF